MSEWFRSWSAKLWYVGSNPILESMEDKLDKILKNQEIINRNQVTIYRELLLVESRLFKSESKEFLRNCLADIAGTITAELGLVDLLNAIKKA